MLEIETQTQTAKSHPNAQTICCYLLTWSLLLAAMGFFTKSFDPSENVDNWNRTPSMDYAGRDCAGLTACFKAPVSLLGMPTVSPGHLQTLCSPAMKGGILHSHYQLPASFGQLSLRGG